MFLWKHKVVRAAEVMTKNVYLVRPCNCRNFQKSPVSLDGETFKVSQMGGMLYSLSYICFEGRGWCHN